MLARGGWGGHEREHPVWYDPHRDQAEIDRALWWQLSQPIHTAPSTGSLRLLPKILNAAERFRSLRRASEQQESCRLAESAVPGTRPRHPASDMSGGGKTYLALDLGAESGRAIAGTFDGELLTLREVYRFPNVPVRRGRECSLGSARALQRGQARHCSRCRPIPR